MNVLSSHTVIRKLGFANHLVVGELVASLVPVALSVALATASWEFFESRILSLKSKLAP